MAEVSLIGLHRWDRHRPDIDPAVILLGPPRTTETATGVAQILHLHLDETEGQLDADNANFDMSFPLCMFPYFVSAHPK